MVFIASTRRKQHNLNSQINIILGLQNVVLEASNFQDYRA